MYLISKAIPLTVSLVSKIVGCIFFLITFNFCFFSEIILIEQNKFIKMIKIYYYIKQLNI